MNYALSVYLVPKNTLLQFPGVADEVFFQECLNAARHRLVDYDDQMYDEDDDSEIREALETAVS